MPKTNKIFRIYYTSKNFIGGLTDVTYHVFKPNGIELGPYTMTEFTVGSAINSGVYYDDFYDADIEGNYLFIVNSLSDPHKDTKSYYFENDIWTTTLRDQIVNDVSIIKKVETKRWKIQNNQMVFFDDDNSTPLLVFDLKDENGDPTMESPFERTPI